MVDPKIVQITMEEFYMGRDKLYPLYLGTLERRNAALTVDLANKLLVLLYNANVPLHTKPKRNIVSSGFRPPAINAATKGAAKKSLHMTCQALDLYDPNNSIDNYLIAEPKFLVNLGLWQEHPSATNGWCHIQTIPPRSGNRVFHP